jgi:hypothetical protein
MDAYSGADDLNCGEPVYLCGICNMNKRAARFSSSMVKNAQRNETMVCNDCASKQCRECGTLMERMHSRDGLICAPCNTFKCKHCPTAIRAGDIVAAAARHATYERVLQMCEGCEAAGKTLADGMPYRCLICREQKYRRRFSETRVNNYFKRSGALHCLDCLKVRARRAVCGLWKKCEEQNWTATKLDDSRRKKNQRG